MHMLSDDTGRNVAFENLSHFGILAQNNTSSNGGDTQSAFLLKNSAREAKLQFSEKSHNSLT